MNYVLAPNRDVFEIWLDETPAQRDQSCYIETAAMGMGRHPKPGDKLVKLYDWERGKSGLFLEAVKAFERRFSHGNETI